MICGKSKELKRSLTAKFKSNENVLILGYTKHMNEWIDKSTYDYETWWYHNN